MASALRAMDASELFGLTGADAGAHARAGLSPSLAVIHLPTHPDMLSAEVEEGNVEYKLHLLHPSTERLRGLVTQLLWRLREGKGTAVYNIGVTDAGEPVGLTHEHMQTSLRTLRNMVASAGGCVITRLVLRRGLRDQSQVAEAVVERLSATGPASHAATASAVDATSGDAIEDAPASASASAAASKGTRAHTHTHARSHVCVGVMGGVGSGKSTLIACATCNTHDDGRGSARFLVFRHRHEVEDGRTSSIGRHTLGFTADGQLVNRSASGVALASAPVGAFGAISGTLGAGEHVDLLTTGQTPADVVRASTHLITLLDMAGDPKYIRTTIAGLLGAAPDYAQITVSATAAMHSSDGSPLDVDAVTKEHIVLALSLRIPVFFVITKADMVPPSAIAQLSDTLTQCVHDLWRTLHPGAPAAAARDGVGLLQDESAAPSEAKRMLHWSADACKPVIMALSCVTGAGMRTWLAFVANLPPRHEWTVNAIESVELRIDDVVTIGSHVVVGGLLARGMLRTGDAVLLGPDLLGNFFPISVASIHINRVPTATAKAGSYISVLVKTPDGADVARSSVRKGQVLIHAASTSSESAPMSALLQRNHSTPAGKDADDLPARAPASLLSTASESTRHGPRDSSRSATAESFQMPARGSRVYAATMFSADVTICSASFVALRVNHDVVVYCACVRQPARVMQVAYVNEPSRGHAATPSRAAHVTLRFLHHPEYLVPGASIVIRSGSNLAAGCISHVTEDARSISAPPAQRVRQQASHALDLGHAAVPASAAVPSRVLSRTHTASSTHPLGGTALERLASRADGVAAHGAHTPEPDAVASIRFGLAHVPPMKFGRPSLTSAVAARRPRFHSVGRADGDVARASAPTEPRKPPDDDDDDGILGGLAFM